MCGKATLAMVESSEFITDAAISTMVMGTRFSMSRADATGGALTLRRGGPHRAGAHVDGDLGREPGAGSHLWWGVVEGDAHGQPLNHLDPVAGSVLRRQRREGRAGAGAEAGDTAPDRLVAVGVDVDGDRL